MMKIKYENRNEKTRNYRNQTYKNGNTWNTKMNFFIIIKNTIEIHYILWGTVILRWRVQIPCILVYSTNKNDNNLDLYYFICLYQSKLINLIMDNLNHQVKK
jgi:hypothetical protein